MSHCSQNSSFELSKYFVNKLIDCWKHQIANYSSNSNLLGEFSIQNYTKENLSEKKKFCFLFSNFSFQVFVFQLKLCDRKVIRSLTSSKQEIINDKRLLLKKTKEKTIEATRQNVNSVLFSNTKNFLFLKKSIVLVNFSIIHDKRGNIQIGMYL
ncbi:hypothetical protein BpHYR1_014701 [Brachionus plicatilis]|uniref:Uncharacterized protein n=1 Tax=Brachionus plicatilis TaxID=10195 RepID=A0A3M7P7I1_BRAPC|nr:hypothetical protein BpHYR1_014701 [Brachionus plicatilis]